VGSPEIGRLQAFRELFEHRLQKGEGSVRPVLTCPKRGQIDRGAQLPSSRRHATAPFKRLQKARFCIVVPGPPCRKKDIAFHAQQLRHVGEVSVSLDQSDRLVAHRDGLVDPADCSQPLRQRDVERSIQELVIRCIELSQTVLQDIDPGSCITLSNGQLCPISSSGRKIRRQGVRFGVRNGPIDIFLGAL
jgi:hypothetical protein